MLATILQLAAVPVPLDGVQPPPSSPLLSAVSRCRNTAEDDAIIVCARNDDRFRLPPPNGRETLPGDRVRGEAPTAASVLVSPGRCGIFEGERRCGKAEASYYGYGNGRDPVSVLGKLGALLIDPDADP